MITFNKRITEIGVTIFFLFLIIISPFFSFSFISNVGMTTIFIIIFAVIMWITRIIPAAITSMMVIVLFSIFKILSFEEAASSLGNEIIWLIITMLILSFAVQKTNLDKRLALFLITFSQGKIIYIYLTLIILSFMLTFIIPTAMGRVTVLIPIALGFINEFKQQIDTNFSKAIILIITFSPYIATLSVLTGAGGSIYSISLFKSMIGYDWTYLHWLIVMLPISFILLIALWFLIIFLFPSRNVYLHSINKYLSNEKKRIGKITSSEKKLLILYFILILLWLTKKVHGMSISMSAMAIVPFVFVPKINIIKWEDAKKNIDWGVPLLFSAGFSIALALEKSGVIDVMKSLLMGYSKIFSGYSFPIMLVLLLVFLRLLFTNYTAMVAALMPVLLSFAIGSTFNPVWLGMLFLVASSTSFLLPSQSAGNMVTFSTHYYGSRDLFILGFFITFILIIVTLIIAFLYWPRVGIPITN